MELFLIGGHDLEMLEIIELLKQNKKNVKDKKLSWGAKLSDYKEELNFEGKIYGIELESDITPPQNYTLIDHHGENDHKPSSLEQIAKILNRELSEEQQLIAANDSRYIQGMQALCATQEEIDKIRTKDRRAQGITQEDEALALQSLQQSDSNTILALTPSFSAISDLAYYKYANYIIYNEQKIVFYGYNKENVLNFLKQQNLDTSDYYYGGGDFGFVGLKDKVCKKDEIKKMIEKFGSKKEELYSYHTFMLPFMFYGEFINLQKNWNYEKFQADTPRDFNEYVYFYKHVQDAIYNKSDSDENAKAGWISKYYEYKEQEGSYSINCKKGVFELEVDGISLRIFNTNVAILSFNLKNTKYKELDDILAINDFGRRIYPQFLGEHYTCATKDAFLANSITLSLKNTKPFKEDFSRFHTKEDLHTIKLLPSFVRHLIDENFESNTNEKRAIRPIIDDRMFVLSWYGNDEFSKSLVDEQYIDNKQWYEYVFVDGDGATVHSKKMQTNLISQATYDRWMDNPWGCTLFGTTRYSFVALTNESDFAKKILLPHMQTMYFQMFTLLLAYRATIIKFADDIQATTDEDDKKLPSETRKIYKKYLNFLNKLYFKEITAQDQGIEIYNQAMKIMDIEKYMDDLDKEINELHSYATMLDEQERSRTLDFLTYLGGILLPPSLIAGYLGMNSIDKNFMSIEHSSALVVTSALIIPVLFGMKKFYKYCTGGES